jgi:hypothetical protein
MTPYLGLRACERLGKNWQVVGILVSGTITNLFESSFLFLYENPTYDISEQAEHSLDLNINSFECNATHTSGYDRK